jgi:hypothetical protein
VDTEATNAALTPAAVSKSISKTEWTTNARRYSVWTRNIAGNMHANTDRCIRRRCCKDAGYMYPAMFPGLYIALQWESNESCSKVTHFTHRCRLLWRSAELQLALRGQWSDIYWRIMLSWLHSEIRSVHSMVSQTVQEVATFYKGG